MNYLKSNITQNIIAKIRQDFPILQRKINNKPLIYLDNAATSHKPKIVIKTISDFYKKYNANINRGPHYLSEIATIQFETARQKVKEFINANSTQECIFTKGTTEAINLVATSFGEKFLQPGDQVILSTMEHHSNIIPWQLLRSRKQIDLKIIPILSNGELDLTNLESLLTANTKLISIAHISNTLGTINPVEKIIAAAHQKNIPVLLDGAQAPGNIKIDVKALNCDFYVFSAHKMFGPTGIGILYGKKKYLDQMPPYQGGGQMIYKVNFEDSIYSDLPYKFEAGTQPIAEAIGLAAAIDYINTLDFAELATYKKNLLNYATCKLQKIANLNIIGTAKDKIAILSFCLNNIHPHDVGSILNSYGIAIRTGHLCTMPIMDFYGIIGLNRISFSIYNTFEEIDSLYKALIKVKKIFKC